MTCSACCTTTNKKQLLSWGLVAGCLLAWHALGNGVCRAQTAPSTASPESALEELEKATSLDHEGAKPWHLKMSFELMSLDGKPEDKGILDVRWTNGSGTLTTIESTKFHGSMPSATTLQGGMRELFLLRQLLEQVLHPVRALRNAAGVETTETTQKFGVVPLRCISLHPKGAPAGSAVVTGSTFCTEPSEPEVLRIVFGTGMEAVRNHLGKFVDVNLALDVAISYYGKPVVSGHIDSLESLPATSDLAQAPSGEPPASVPSVVLSGLKLSGDQPEYPLQGRMERLGGAVVLAALIDKQGKISDLEPVAATNSIFIEPSLKAVRTWRYRPYLLHASPTEVSTSITVNYNMGVR